MVAVVVMVAMKAALMVVTMAELEGAVMEARVAAAALEAAMAITVPTVVPEVGAMV